MNLAELNKVAEAMVAPGRGILAADESTGTIKKRFDAIGVESTPITRRDYREMLFRSAEAMSKYISGVILYDETIRQNAKDGTPLVKLIEQAGSLPGIKVDKGTKPLPFCPDEVITEGLDGLRERLVEYRGLGAKFAKWRAVIDIGPGIPSYDVHHDQRARARALRGAVPGRRHRADRRAGSADGRRSRRRPLRHDHRMGAAKPCSSSSTTSASRSKAWCSSRTWWCPARSRRSAPRSRKSPRRRCACSRPACRRRFPASRSCPAASPTRKRPRISTPSTKWARCRGDVTFSYGRALQAAPQKAWSGKSENVAAAQRAFGHRAMMNGLAALGQWKADLERKAA